VLLLTGMPVANTPIYYEPGVPIRHHIPDQGTFPHRRRFVNTELSRPKCGFQTGPPVLTFIGG